MARDKRLDTYAQKRKPEATPEPMGESPLEPRETWEGSFVVHLHDATRRHFDFRLESAGVLSSFAVPHGPPVETTDKRLAINTEDHPIEYLDFEGVIPDGNYGAGPMVVWDRGRVTYLEQCIEKGVPEGKVDFVLHGHKLRGRFALVKLKSNKAHANKGNEWLLLKKAEGAESPPRNLDEEFPRSVLSGLRVDELERAPQIAAAWEKRAAQLAKAHKAAPWNGARAAAGLSASFTPPLAPVRAVRTTKAIPSDEGWDPWLGGARAFVVKHESEVRVWFDDGARIEEVSVFYPELCAALRAHPLRAMVLDGEIAVFDASGHASFAALSRRVHKIRDEGPLAARELPVTFVAIDVIAVGDSDLRRVPSRERRALLAELLPVRGVMRTQAPLESEPAVLDTIAVNHHLLGWIGRAPGSAYEQGAWTRLVPDGAPPSVRALDHDVRRVKVAAREVRVTNPQKIFFPEPGITKGELIAYYTELANEILPLITDRPLVLVRYPDGVNGKSFFQWNVPPGSPEWLESVTLSHSEKPDSQGFVVRNRESLAYIANLGCIPIHMLACTRAHMDACDFFTIDFDVNMSKLEHAITLANTLHEWLQATELTGFPKTSGQTGLHVLVPLATGTSFATACGLADLFGGLLVRKFPELATMERMKERRGERVYVDTGQTGDTRAIVSPYSVRATALATVSMPLYWSDVTRDLDPRVFTLRDAPAWVRKHGDAMAAFTTTKPDLARTMKLLETLVRDLS